VLDRSVLSGYSNLGHRIGHRGWSPSELHRLDGKVVLITGATSGLGQAAAERLAGLGVTVWLAARNRERAEHARADRRALRKPRRADR
jgi:NADPH:quinone reductase-like Zn-dependent oxidoreductase